MATKKSNDEKKENEEQPQEKGKGSGRQRRELNREQLEKLRDRLQKRFH